MTTKDTLKRIIDKHGEALMVSQVMRLLNCGRLKVQLLCDDGYLTRTMDGRRISAASVAAYIDGDQREIDHARRMAKKYPYRTV